MRALCQEQIGMRIEGSKVLRVKLDEKLILANVVKSGKACAVYLYRFEKHVERSDPQSALSVQSTIENQCFPGFAVMNDID